MNFTAQDMNDFKTFDGTLEEFCKKVKNKVLDPLGTIFDIVKREFGVEDVDFPTRTRSRKTVSAMQAAHWFSYYFTTRTIEDIGNEINKRNHCTVLHSKDKVNDFKEIYQDWKLKINKIEHELFSMGIHRCYYGDRKNYVPYSEARRPELINAPKVESSRGELVKVEIAEEPVKNPRRRVSEPVRETISPEQRVDALYEELEFCDVNRGVEISREIDLLQAKINARNNRAKEAKRRKRKEYNISKL